MRIVFIEGCHALHFPISPHTSSGQSYNLRRISSALSTSFALIAYSCLVVLTHATMDFRIAIDSPVSIARMQSGIILSFAQSPPSIISGIYTTMCVIFGGKGTKKIPHAQVHARFLCVFSYFTDSIGHILLHTQPVNTIYAIIVILNSQKQS